MPPKKQPPPPPSPAPPATAPTYNALKYTYPGRESQIDTLVSFLNTSGLIYASGPPGTAKTSVICDLLSPAALNIPHAYINCVELNRTRSIFESILGQLSFVGGSSQRKRRRPDNGDNNNSDHHATTVRCDSASEFRIQLPKVVAAIAAKSKTNGCPWIVLDNAERLAGSDVLGTLAEATPTTGLILISQLPWGAGRFRVGSKPLPPPTQVHFQPYTPQQLQNILLTPSSMAHLANSTLTPQLRSYYSQCVKLAVPTLSRATNSLLDIRSAVDRLWGLYSAPLLQPQAQAQAQARVGRGPLSLPLPSASTLGGQVRNELQKMVSELEMGGGIGSGRGNGGGSTAASVAFELPYISKVLLLAAYIASRNKPATDRAVFDPGYSKRGRKNAQALDRLTEAAIEATLRGPHAFPLERLLHIFYCLYEQHGLHEDETQGTTANGDWDRPHATSTSTSTSTIGTAGIGYEIQRAEVQMQLSTLVSLRLLTATGDVLNGASYRCCLSDEAAQTIASNMKLPLQEYLKFA